MTIADSQSRILGIDYGSRRIGLSLSDPLGLIATPIDALQNDGSLFNNLIGIIASEKIRIVVVGMPLNLKGELGKKSQEVREFIDLLRTKTDAEIMVWDERFTTKIAQNTMIAMGTKKKERAKREGRIDSMAASVMLQGYLDNSNRRHEN